MNELFLSITSWRKEDEPHATRVARRTSRLFICMILTWTVNHHSCSVVKECRNLIRELNLIEVCARSLNCCSLFSSRWWECWIDRSIHCTTLSIRRTMRETMRSLHQFPCSRYDWVFSRETKGESCSLVCKRTSWKDVFMNVMNAESRAEREEEESTLLATTDIEIILMLIIQHQNNSLWGLSPVGASLLQGSIGAPVAYSENLRPWSCNEKSSWSLPSYTARIKKDQEESGRTFSRKKTWLTHTHELEMIAGKLNWTSYL